MGQTSMTWRTILAPSTRGIVSSLAVVTAACWLALGGGCNLFEPRDPQAPSQTSDSFIPPTDPDVVVENLQNAIAQKNSVNYIRCFADPTRTPRLFVFIPSPDAGGRYASVFATWGVDQERTYFQNLVARASGKVNAYSNLVLANKTLTLTADSAVETYDYTLTFEHNDPSFPTVATGNMALVLGLDNNNAWVIYRWTDFKTTSDVTWSHFKGKFSN
jgi:hypothetical protein